MKGVTTRAGPGRSAGAALLALLAAAPVAAGAQTLRSVSIRAENDGFAPAPQRLRTDWYYTHGMDVGAVLAWAPPGASLLGGGDPRPCATEPAAEPCLLFRVGVGQAIYTPAALFTYRGESTDRPYAGWLYVDLTAARVSPGSTRSLGLQLGVTGEPSMASSVHRWFHRVLGVHEPVGWEYQIPFEVAFRLRYETRGNHALGSGGWGLEPRAAFDAGTLRSGATGGLGLTWSSEGAGLQDWIGPRGRPWLAASLGAEGELVLRDLFLDGSTWHDGPSTEREPLVGRIAARVRGGFEHVALEFALTRTSRAFRGQRAGHSYGTFGLVLRP